MAERVQGALNTHVETLSAKIESLRDEVWIILTIKKRFLKIFDNWTQANQKLQAVEQAQREAQTSLKALADERNANTNRRWFVFEILKFKTDEQFIIDWIQLMIKWIKLMKTLPTFNQK